MNKLNPILVFFLNILCLSIVVGQENCENARMVYLIENPDVKNYGTDPWNHYRSFGKKEGRKWPSCSAISYIIEDCELANNLYLDENPDVKKNGMEAWKHYEYFGKKEGRIWPKCLYNHIYWNPNFFKSYGSDYVLGPKGNVVTLYNLSMENYYKKVKDTAYHININSTNPLKINNTFILNDIKYNGIYYSYYDNKQIKSITEIKKGIVDGLVVEFWKNNSYDSNSFADTAIINNFNYNIQNAKRDLLSCLIDTAIICKAERDFLINDIGGFEKLQKLILKNNEDKLNDKKKSLLDQYIDLSKRVDSTQNRLYFIHKSIVELEKKLNTESSKKVFTPVKSSEYQQIDTLKEGKAIIYNASGVKIAEGEYKNNLENNKWTFYFNNSIIEETDYELGQIHGVKKTYDKNGKIQSEALYKKGELHGIKKEFYENGEIYSTTEYVNGKKSGMYNVFKSNQQGKQFECYYLNDKKNGKEINYNLTGNFIYWEYSYLNDEKDGPFKEYYDNGSIKNEGTFSKNRKNGLYKEYFLNGKLKLDANFTNDKRNGKHKTFYESGQIETEILYANDKEYGLKISYYSNGKLNRKTTVDTNSLAVIYAYPFNDNNVVGDYYKYNEDGTLSNHYFAYKDGRLDIKFPKPEPVVISSAKTAPNPQVSNANNGPHWVCSRCHETRWGELDWTGDRFQKPDNLGCPEYGKSHSWESIILNSNNGPSWECSRCHEMRWGYLDWTGDDIQKPDNLGCPEYGKSHSWDRKY
jgi:antitoxin component YwqK of YwqJK toxin-antitoxin module